jgi:tetratricopeptide (TPR) repeat protein
LSGFSTQGLGQYQKAIAEAGKAIELDPDSTPVYLNLASGYMSLNRFNEAEAALKRAADRQLEIPDSQILGFYVAFLKNDEDGMNRAKRRMQGMPDEEDWMLQSEALVATSAGRLRRARALSEQAVESAQRSGHTERAAIYRAGSAAWEALFGNVAEARKNAADAMKLSDARDVEYGAAFALSLAHDDVRAQALAIDLAKRYPEDTLVRFTYSPALSALASLHRRRPAESLSMLQTNLAFEFATPGTNFFGFFGGLYPVYLRGQCHLSLGKGDEAAQEFQKIVDHPGIVFADPIGALAHLEIGRAFALSRNRAGAKAAYQGFLTLWRDADADIPILKQAKAEWATLN